MNPKAFVLTRITDHSPASRKLTERFIRGLAEKFQVGALQFSDNMPHPTDNIALIELKDFQFVSVRLPASQPKAVFALIEKLSDCLGQPRYLEVDESAETGLQSRQVTA